MNIEMIYNITTPFSVLRRRRYCYFMDIKKWAGRRQDWSIIHAQLAVYFADRMPD
jgi:hypothetical protein